ncbi:hypothetical protein [Nonomuraea sp. NPDC050786]|uniref:hypothetical protein n=1 Tax=Nonomuraea sp. NPDC050786 TaxID=3154840 RepID=UPI0034026169
MSAVTEELIARAAAFAMLDLDNEQIARIAADVQIGVTACDHDHGHGACLDCLERSLNDVLTGLGFEVGTYDAWRMASVIQNWI